MPSLVETSRTSMRPFDLGDAEEAFSWLSDSAVMQYIPFGADSTIEDTIARIGRYIDHQNKYGFSKWVVEDRETKRLVGDAGFYVMPEEYGNRAWLSACPITLGPRARDGSCRKMD